MIGCFIAAGFAQSKISESKKNDAHQNGLQVEQVETERDYFDDLQRSEEKKKKDSFILQSEKTAVLKNMEKTNSQSKIYSADNVKPNQIISKEGAIHFGQGKEQIVSRIKRTKKIGRVEGIASREEIKKINGHAPVSEEVLIRALGNPKRIEARSSKK